MYASSRTFEVISIRASKNFRRILLVQTEVKHDHCWPPFLVNCQKSWVITLRLQWISTNRRDRDQIGKDYNIARLLSFIINILHAEIFLLSFGTICGEKLRDCYPKYSDCFIFFSSVASSSEFRYFRKIKIRIWKFVKIVKMNKRSTLLELIESIKVRCVQTWLTFLKTTY